MVRVAEIQPTMKHNAKANNLKNTGICLAILQGDKVKVRRSWGGVTIWTISISYIHIYIYISTHTRTCPCMPILCPIRRLFARDLLESYDWCTFPGAGRRFPSAESSAPSGCADWMSPTRILTVQERLLDLAGSLISAKQATVKHPAF